MKKFIAISRIFTVALLSVLSFSCVKDTDYEIPDVGGTASKFDGEIKTIDQVKAVSSDQVKEYQANDAVEGYVISSDKGGNFYQKIYVQNADRTAAFAVSLEGQALYGQYPLGSKVRLQLKGLTTQLVDGFLEVGSKTYTAKNGTVSVGRVPKSAYEVAFVNLNESKPYAELAKKSASVAELLVDGNTGMLVTFENVQFSSSDIGKPLHQASNDKFAGTDYNLTDATSKSVVFRTSRYAKFKDQTVPSGKLNVTGVLTKYRGKFQFMVNTFDDIQVVGTSDNTPTSGDTSNIKELNASSATATDYVAGTKVKLTGIITVEGSGKSTRSYIIFSDQTKIQLYAAKGLYNKLSEETKTKLNTPNQSITVTGVFTDFQLKNGTVVKEIVYEREEDLVFGELANTDTTTNNNNDSTSNDTVDSGTTSSSNSFNFEGLQDTNSYNQSGTLTADGVTLEYKNVRTNMDKYSISGGGLMLKKSGSIKLTFSKSVSSVTFKTRAAYTSKDQRKVTVYDGDENSTTVLKEHSFGLDTTETVTVDVSGKSPSFSITIKNTTSKDKQIVIDDITWN